jgi:hypothetical protein
MSRSGTLDFEWIANRRAANADVARWQMPPCRRVTTAGRCANGRLQVWAGCTTAAEALLGVIRVHDWQKRSDERGWDVPDTAEMLPPVHLVTQTGGVRGARGGYLCGRLPLERIARVFSVAHFLAVQTISSPGHCGQTFGRDRLLAVEANSKLATLDAL